MLYKRIRNTMDNFAWSHRCQIVGINPYDPVILRYSKGVSVYNVDVYDAASGKKICITTGGENWSKTRFEREEE